MAVANGSFVSIEFLQFPGVTAERKPGRGVQAKKGDRTGLVRAEFDSFETGEIGDWQRDAADDLKHTRRITLADGERLLLGIQQEQGLNRIGTIRHSSRPNQP